jgi:hypothetical protein
LDAEKSWAPPHGKGRFAGEYRVMKRTCERPFGYMLIINLWNYILNIDALFAFNALRVDRCKGGCWKGCNACAVLSHDVWQPMSATFARLLMA